MFELPRGGGIQLLGQTFQSLSGLTLCLNGQASHARRVFSEFQSLSGLTLCLNIFLNYTSIPIDARFNPFQG